MRSRRPSVRLFLLAVGAATTAACQAGAGGFAAGDRAWAPLPEEAPMPAAAPDDPETYRGVRYRMANPHAGPVEAAGRPVPWLESTIGEYTSVGRGWAPGPYFGYQNMNDGRRQMVWFFRLVEDPAPIFHPDPPRPVPPLATTAPPPRPGSPGSRAATPAPTPPASETPHAGYLPPRQPDPPRAVLDVLVLSGRTSGLRTGCGPDPVILDSGAAWRLDRVTGRIQPMDPDDATCPED